MIILAYANYVIEAFMYDFRNGSKEIIQNGNLVSFFFEGSKFENSMERIPSKNENAILERIFAILYFHPRLFWRIARLS